LQVTRVSGDIDNPFYGTGDAYRLMVGKPHEKLGVIRVLTFGKIFIQQIFL
jgi:hypothetical protein